MSSKEEERKNKMRESQAKRHELIRENARLVHAQTLTIKELQEEIRLLGTYKDIMDEKIERLKSELLAYFKQLVADFQKMKLDRREEIDNLFNSVQNVEKHIIHISKNINNVQSTKQCVEPDTQPVVDTVKVQKEKKLRSYSSPGFYL